MFSDVLTGGGTAHPKSQLPVAAGCHQLFGPELLLQPHLPTPGGLLSPQNGQVVPSLLDFVLSLLTGVPHPTQLSGANYSPLLGCSRNSSLTEQPRGEYLAPALAPRSSSGPSSTPTCFYSALSLAMRLFSSLSGMPVPPPGSPRAHMSCSPGSSSGHTLVGTKEGLLNQTGLTTGPALSACYRPPHTHLAGSGT